MITHLPFISAHIYECNSRDSYSLFHNEFETEAQISERVKRRIAISREPRCRQSKHISQRLKGHAEHKKIYLIAKGL